jgi:hypothetical protein
MRHSITIGICVAFAGIATAHESTDLLAVWYRSLTHGGRQIVLRDARLSAGRGTDQGRPLGGLDFSL